MTTAANDAQIAMNVQACDGCSFRLLAGQHLHFDQVHPGPSPLRRIEHLRLRMQPCNRR